MSYLSTYCICFHLIRLRNRTCHCTPRIYRCIGRLHRLLHVVDKQELVVVVVETLKGPEVNPFSF